MTKSSEQGGKRFHSACCRNDLLWSQIPRPYRSRMLPVCCHGMRWEGERACAVPMEKSLDDGRESRRGLSRTPDQGGRLREFRRITYTCSHAFACCLPSMPISPPSHLQAVCTFERVINGTCASFHQRQPYQPASPDLDRSTFISASCR
jgi:hypothetical protein